LSNQHVSGHIWESQIAQNDVEIAPVGQIDGLTAASGGDHFGPFYAQKHGKNLPDVGGIFNQKDSPSLQAHEMYFSVQ
jgi:hypothetical protein